MRRWVDLSTLEKDDGSLINVYGLTLVAFVFIPLNFATSFFGMNVQQLGTGSVHIGFSFLAAALAGFLSWVTQYPSLKHVFVNKYVATAGPCGRNGLERGL